MFSCMGGGNCGVDDAPLLIIMGWQLIILDISPSLTCLQARTSG